MAYISMIPVMMTKINVRLVENDEEKVIIAKKILEALPDYFGIPEATSVYIQDSRGKIFLSADDENQPVGFLYLKETSKYTVEIAVMGVLPEYHRQGIGRTLITQAKDIAKQNGYSFMQVKTVQMGIYEDYDKTNRFYQAMGFKELEVFPTLWDEKNPCLIYVMIV